MPEPHAPPIPASPLGPEMYGPATPLALLAEGEFNMLSAKTAFGILRHAPNPCVAVIDSKRAGTTVREVTGIDCDTPIVASVEEAIALGAEVLVIGTAPTGGQLPEAWREIIITCLSNGVDVAAGLHTDLGDDPHFAEVAERHGRRIFDVRRPPRGIGVARGACRHLEGKRIVLIVGTDCATGKMHTALALEEELARRGASVKFVPTGQTGVFIKGWGIAIDNVISDFTAGAVELMVLEAAKEADIILVEGQGALLHPGFSGVTLSLIHGCMPTDMIFCHSATPVCLEPDYDMTPPPMPEMIALHEHVVEHLRPARVIGIALNTNRLDETAARRMVDDIHRETDLPVTDVVRFGPAPLADLLMP